MSSERAPSASAPAPRRAAPRIRPLVRRACSAVRLGRRDKLLIAEAMAALFSAWLRSELLPFPKLARQIAGLAPAGTPQPLVSLGPADEATVRKVRWAVRVVAPLMPFRTACLQQAIAARAMLARHGIASVMHLGVRHPVIGRMEAHAWLEAGDIRVTGYPLDPAMAEVVRFI